jgi:hypothetical protein
LLWRPMRITGSGKWLSQRSIFTLHSPDSENLNSTREGQYSCVQNPLPTNPGGGFFCAERFNAPTLIDFIA